MAEGKTIYGLTARAAKLVKEMVDKHRQRLPNTGRRGRRISGTATR